MENSKTEAGGAKPEGDALRQLSDALAGAVERVSPFIVAVNGRQRIPSSGVVWRQGVVVTAAHAIKRVEEISLTLPNGRSVPATLAGRDAGTDLAVLKFEHASPEGEATQTEAAAASSPSSSSSSSSEAAQPAAETATGEEAALRVGQIVLAVGRLGGGGVSAALGIVSALGGAWRTWRGGEIDRFIRLDVSLYPGASGGALVDASGRVLGINTSGLSRFAGLTIPVSTVNRVVAQLLEKGRIARGYLGVGMQPVGLPRALRERLKLETKTALIVLGVEPDSPADRGGVIVGDIVVGFDGKSVGDTDDVQSMLGAESVGRALKLSVVRGGELLELNVTVGERPGRSC